MDLIAGMLAYDLVLSPEKKQKEPRRQLGLSWITVQYNKSKSLKKKAINILASEIRPQEKQSPSNYKALYLIQW